jgi:hypothetical protein
VDYTEMILLWPPRPMSFSARRTYRRNRHPHNWLTCTGVCGIIGKTLKALMGKSKFDGAARERGTPQSGSVVKARPAKRIENPPGAAN